MSVEQPKHQDYQVAFVAPSSGPFGLAYLSRMILEDPAQTLRASSLFALRALNR